MFSRLLLKLFTLGDSFASGSVCRILIDQLTRGLTGLFGQRWKTETVHSVIKRKFGDQIRSTLKSRQNQEPIIKALVYNLHR